MELNRHHLAEFIVDRLKEEASQMRLSYENSKEKIGHFYIDDLLPEDIATSIYRSFPKLEETVLKKSLREYKHIAVQMDQYDPIIEEITYAFQDPRVVGVIEELCNIPNLVPDENLYAGGLSMMSQNNFLNPHLDNSHDKDRNRWRVLNLLYYVSPNWNLENGGNLEIWPEGLDHENITIISKFNRLAVMATHQRSWHSVSKVVVNKTRCCVSNYYFSSEPLLQDDSFHVTSFRGFPKQKLLDVILKMDTSLRMRIRKIFNKGIKENPHVYKKKDQL